MKQTTILIIAAALFGVSATQAAEQALKAELNNYIEIFSGENFAAQRNAIEPLGWSGYSDPALYDIIADKLSELRSADSKVEKERASWFAKALALSGNMKYQPLLLEIERDADAKKLRKHARVALERLPTYARWNPVIAENLDSTKLPLEEQRIRNMLAAPDMQLVRLGLKRIYHAHASDKELVALAREFLENNYAAARSDDATDTVSWAIKVMAQSGDPGHKPLLGEIKESAGNKKVRKYAKKYYKYL